MDKMEKFCLKWNDFENNIGRAFKDLREEKEFFDVTLACDDEQIQAHKVILSACSPFFKSVLRKNLHQHPLLYFKGIKFVDLMSVISFMYEGEVNIAQENLNSFLLVAEDLKVKGLTQSKSKPNARNEETENKVNQTNVKQRYTPAKDSSSDETNPIAPVDCNMISSVKSEAVYPTTDDSYQQQFLTENNQIYNEMEFDEEYEGFEDSQNEAVSTILKAEGECKVQLNNHEQNIYILFFFRKL